MKITSNFLGITLNKTRIKTLFNSLKQYLEKNNIQKVIEIQNLNSAHITSYYFDKIIDEIILKEIKNDLINLNKEKINITLKRINFFKKEGIDYICYISPQEQKKLKEINLRLRQKYPNNIVDNNYKYIPHTTIFKIKDFSNYKKHEENISNLINKFILKNNQTNFFKSFNLYTVDSTKSPEKQKIIV